MGDHLEQAAKFSKSRESTLNVSDSVSFIPRPRAAQMVGLVGPGPHHF